MKPAFHLQAKAEVNTSAELRGTDKWTRHWKITMQVKGLQDAVTAGAYAMYLGPALIAHLQAAGIPGEPVIASVDDPPRRFGAETTATMLSYDRDHAMRLRGLVYDFACREMLSWGWQPTILETVH